MAALGDAVPDRRSDDHASLYWFTNTSASSARFIREPPGRDPRRRERVPANVPIGLALVRLDSAHLQVRRARHSNIVHWNDYDRGGHWQRTCFEP